MASKGESKVEKRLATSKVRKVKRKEKKFTIRAKPGPHNRKNSVPLGFVLRDLLKVTKNLRETKFVLNNNEVMVDGKIRKDYKFAIGLFDVISLMKKKKNYRMVFDDNGRLIAKEIPFKCKITKLCKIVGKKAIKGNKTQLETNDGRTFLEEKTSLKVGDSLKIELPNQKIVARFELKKDNIAYVVGGTHIGAKAKISEIIEGTMRRDKLIALKPFEGEAFSTVARNVFVVGEKKPEIEVLEE